MITAWDIYWVMQLDSISCTITFFTIAATIAAACFYGIGALVTDRGCYPSTKQDESWERTKNRARWMVVAAFAFGFAGAFIPSTKTAAMMLVIPAVANNEAIQKEAGDLYGIAKDALRELAKPKPEKSE